MWIKVGVCLPPAPEAEPVPGVQERSKMLRANAMRSPSMTGLPVGANGENQMGGNRPAAVTPRPRRRQPDGA